MGIKIVFGLAEDVKPEFNVSSDKVRFFAPFMVKVFFVNEETGAVLFTYVPKITDEKLFSDAFKLIKDYDVKRKDLADFIKDHEVKK